MMKYRLELYVYRHKSKRLYGGDWRLDWKCPARSGLVLHFWSQLTPYNCYTSTFMARWMAMNYIYKNKMYIHQPQSIVQRLDKSHGSPPRKNYSKNTKRIIRTSVTLQQLTTGQCVMTHMKEHSFSFIAIKCFFFLLTSFILTSSVLF